MAKLKRSYEPSVGDLVWARTGLGSHEEPALILKVGCDVDESLDDNDGGHKSDKLPSGVLVRFTVSFYEGVFTMDRIRPMEEATAGSRRRSNRTATPPPNLPVSQKPLHKEDIKPRVTPSPSSCATSDTADSMESEEPEERKRPSKRKSSSKIESKTAKKSKPTKTASGNAKEDSKKTDNVAAKKDVPPASGKVGVEKKNKKAKAVSSQASSSPHFDKKKGAAASKKTKKAAASDVGRESRIFENNNSDESEDDAALDRPFRIEYSKTGRATCRRCDEYIKKGELRIAHTPLFRGKPGFQVYRHLQCAVFSEEVHCAEDVGGYSKLTPEDFSKLVERVEESKEEVRQEAEALEPDELVQAAFQGEIRSAPPGLSATLLPFQVEGMSWMHHQEVKVTELRSGILADEMGMGKTLQTIATILDNRPRLQHSKPGAKHPPTPDRDQLIREASLWDDSLADWKHEMDMNNIPASLRPKARGKQPGGGARAGTLVICPVIALSQWKTEIEKFTDNGTLSVCVYHGPNRSSQTPRQMLTKYDIVLTTYQVLEADFRKMVSPNKVKCPNCGNKFKVDKLRVHLKYFCGEGAQRTEAQARQQSNRDRMQARARGGAPGGKSRGTKKSFSKPQALRAKSKKKSPETASKHSVHVKRSAYYDSESDLSVEEAPPVVTGRPSRSAAVNASKRMSSSKKDWGFGVNGSDSEDYKDDDVSSSDESSDDELVKPKAKPKMPSSSKETSESESSSTDDEEAVQRAREKQRKAMLQARKTKKVGMAEGSRKGSAGTEQKKGQKKKASTNGKKKKKKRFNDSSSSGISDEERDALEGIDMERLVQEAMEGSVMSPLHSLCWWRVVLDEAHFIKSRSSQTAAAAFALIGIHRWCLSGTPLQNRVGEFYSLIRFLRIDPMAHYFCKAKGCDCKSLHYRMLNGKCQGCGHGSVQHYSYFNKHVLNPIQRDGYSGDGRRAMFKLKNDILDTCLLRRTKETRAEDMNLPPRLVTIRSVRLHPVEEDFYNALYTQTRSSFDDYVADGTLLNNYAHIFDLLMRMRQAVSHPYLVVYSKKDRVVPSAGGAPIANGSADCALCHEPPTERVVSSCCQDAFCRGCVLEYMSTTLNLPGSENTPCPSCRNPFSIDLNQVSSNVVDDSTLSIGSRNGNAASSPMPSLKELPHVATGSILRRINLAEFATSSKIEALTEELVKMRQDSPGSKAIVFSQFVNMLDLIRWRLHSDPCLSSIGLGARALHGGMDVKARDAALKDFREDNEVRVLLMSLKAGGVALNLTVANRIFLMDPWWNPAAELQAIDRTHRLGQHRPIKAVRFIADNTVEERIVQLQEKKRLVFDGTVGRDAGSLKMLTVDDMKSLFC